MNDDMGAAWAEVEAALPQKDWMLEVVRSGVMAGDVNPHTGRTLSVPKHPYIAVAQPSWYPLDGSDPDEFKTEGDTPAAALRELAVRLRDAATDEAERKWSEPLPRDGQ